MYGLPMPSMPKIGAVGLGEDDALQVQGAGLDDHADHGQHHGQLVGDELAGGAEATDAASTCWPRPSPP